MSGVEGALELIESLKHNTTLEKLKLSMKSIPSSFSTLDMVTFWYYYSSAHVDSLISQHMIAT